MSEHDKQTLKLSMFMTWAYDASKLAKDSRQYGCIITNYSMNKVLSIGYNGGAKAQSDTPKSFEPGKSALVHAELNALLMLDTSEPSYGRMFLTHSPCLMCAKYIINSNRVKFLYYDKLTNFESLVLLKEAGIRVFQVVEQSNESK